MLLIAGGGSFITLLNGKTDLIFIDYLANQLSHPTWHGFTFYDFIFPLFLFLAGVSLVFSISAAEARGFTKSQIYRKVFKRMLILIALGMLYKNAPIPFNEPSQIRFGSVLGRIGFATFIATILYLNFSNIKRIYWAAGILLAYYAVLFLIPVPGFGAGDLSFEGNLVGWFDRQFMPGRLLQGSYDELGILTQLPALCLTILGAWAGDILMHKKEAEDPTLRIILIGIILLTLGLFWSLHFPINKHLWTSSFILLTSGMAFLFIGIFYWLIEVRGYRKWAFFFKVIGVNSLLIYLIYRFINFGHTSQLLFDGIIDFFPEAFHDAFVAFGAVMLVWLFLYICFRNKLFLKV